MSARQDRHGLRLPPRFTPEAREEPFPRRGSLRRTSSGPFSLPVAFQPVGLRPGPTTPDEELRGAGDILGEEQAGHVNAVGYELYLELLEEAVRNAKGEEVRIA